MTCPTSCDDDCFMWCHATHHVTWKRDHDPDKCPGQRCRFVSGCSPPDFEPERCVLVDNHEGECE